MLFDKSKAFLEQVFSSLLVLFESILDELKYCLKTPILAKLIWTSVTPDTKALLTNLSFDKGFVTTIAAFDGA